MANSSNNESAPVYSLKHFLPPIVVLWKTCTLVKETNSFGDHSILRWHDYVRKSNAGQMVLEQSFHQASWYVLISPSKEDKILGTFWGGYRWILQKFKPGEFPSPEKSILPFSLGFRRSKKNNRLLGPEDSLSSHHQDHDTFSTEIPYVICHLHPGWRGRSSPVVGTRHNDLCFWLDFNGCCRLLKSPTWTAPKTEILGIPINDIDVCILIYIYTYI